MAEQVICCKLLQGTGDVSDGLLFAAFHKDEVLLTLWSDNETFYQSGGNSFSDGLFGLLDKNPLYTSIQLKHTVGIKRSSSVEMIEIEENISIVDIDYIEERALCFTLKTVLDENIYEIEQTEDFSLALEKLRKKLGIEFLICAYCQNADFKSHGGEDLRHGWYCFRGQEVDLTVVWHQRLESFDRARSNLDAFHWCPSFKKRIDI